MPKIESFEKNSDAYDDWFENNHDLYEAELEAVRQLISPLGAEGVEVGVGSGKFAEAFRVLKLGGFIIIGFVDKASKFYKEATFFSAQEVLKDLEEAGFQPEKIKQTLIPEALPASILDGFGKGAFVVIRGVKNKFENS